MIKKVNTEHTKVIRCRSKDKIAISFWEEKGKIIQGKTVGKKNSKFKIKNEMHHAYKCVDQKMGWQDSCLIFRNSKKKIKC